VRTFENHPPANTGLPNFRGLRYPAWGRLFARRPSVDDLHAPLDAALTQALLGYLNFSDGRKAISGTSKGEVLDK
jgi:hypothetical protein